MAENLSIPTLDALLDPEHGLAKYAHLFSPQTPLQQPPNAQPPVTAPQSAPSMTAPQVAPTSAPNMATADIPSLAKPTRSQSNTAGKEEFKEGLPSVTALPGTPEYGQQRQEQLDYQKLHPWGSDVSAKPGVWGKIGHIASRVGNIAGDILDPAATERIPGSDLNRAEQTKQNEGWIELGEENKLKEAQAGGWAPLPVQLPNGQTIMVPARNAATIAAKDIGEAGANERNANTVKGEGERTDKQQEGANQRVTQQQEGETNRTLSQEEARASEGEKNRQNQQQIAQMRDATSKLIASDRNAIEKEKADATADPNKLTNTMKTMKQQAQATLPQIDKAISETESVKDLLGPAEGRWNDFMQGKLGVSDQRFAHYRDEIHMVSTAVTLAHARGRMSNELYESFQNMFDAGKQSPENMIQALDVAKEWLSGYAEMGEPGSSTGGGAPAAPGAASIPSFSDFQKSKKNGK